MVCRRWRAVLFCAVAFPIILTTAGCGQDALLRQPVAGFVYLDGRPLAAGIIMFYPVANTDVSIVSNAGAMIDNGYFSVPRSGGLVPGQYHVAIRGPEPEKRHRRESREPGSDAAVAKEVIPDKYNSETELRLELKENSIKEVTFYLDSH